MREYDVMIAGHLCLDVIPQFPDNGQRDIASIMRPGKLVNVNSAKISTGGPVSNTGLNLKKLGLNVCFCSCVGDDKFGKMAIEILGENGNADGISIRQDCTSSYTIVVAPPGIDRIFLHNPGTNDLFTSEDLDVEMIRKSRHFHFGYPPLMKEMFSRGGEELVKIFRIAKEAGATTSCDMTLPDPASDSGKAPWRDILEKLMPYVDIYVPSIEETFYMLYPDEFLEMKAAHDNAELIDFISADKYTSIADEILNMGAGMVTLKSGHRGFYIRTGSVDRIQRFGAGKPSDVSNWAERQLWVPAYKVENLASATGSGDSSIAGLLAGFIRGLSIEQSLKYAVCLGYQNVQVLDAVSGIKDWQQTTELINSDMPVIDVNMDSEGWLFDNEYNVWENKCAVSVKE
ncbi:MAG: carbohydrate kinase family protein [Sedimentisphaeraceae bacterium JB056]